MDMNDFRKSIFLNSQYCNYYIDKGCTVLSGVMRSIGYKYSVKLPKEKMTQINAVYRKFTTVMNCLVGAEIILYVYLFMFPCFLKLIKLPFFVLALTLCIIPLIMLYLTYIAVNYLYENYLTRYVGTFQKVKFLPNIYNIEPEAYEKYRKTPKKSIYVMAVMMIAFLYYALMPMVIDNQVSAEKYDKAVKSADVYSKFIPISPDVYAQRAYAKFKLGKYEEAAADYKLANDYSMSNVFNMDILGVKTYYFPFDLMINEFDAEIARRDKKIEQQFIMAEKANYLMKNKKYNQALGIYNELVNTYKNRQDTAFAPDEIYFNRGRARALTGDAQGARTDTEIARKMCSECEYDFETNLVRKP